MSQNLETNSDDINYSQRAQWLRAAVLGANDGLVSTASLMMGVGAVKDDVRAMVLSGFAGLVAGACSMAIGEFVSVYSQLDIEVEQMKREQNMNEREGSKVDGAARGLPVPAHAALASALAFSMGAAVPLLAAGFIRRYETRLIVVVVATSLAMVVFGWVGAALGHASPVRSVLRVLLGGWVAMVITFGLMKLFRCTGL